MQRLHPATGFDFSSRCSDSGCAFGFQATLIFPRKVDTLKRQVWLNVARMLLALRSPG